MSPIEASVAPQRIALDTPQQSGRYGRLLPTLQQDTARPRRDVARFERFGWINNTSRPARREWFECNGRYPSFTCPANH
jgi:hypothetical protein